MLLRWYHATPPLPQEEALLAQALDAVAPQVTALTAQLPPRLVASVVTPLLQRWTATCWDLPASAAHHHSRPFGLLQHSLEVATHALTAFTRSSHWWTHVPDLAAQHRAQARWRLGTALAGLLHDAGKLFDVTVTLTPAAPAAPCRWDPLSEPLLTWLVRSQQAGVLPTPTVHWQPGRGTQHTAAGALAATLVLTRADLVALTVPVARELWSFLSGCADPANGFYPLIVRAPGAVSTPAADGQSVQTDLATLPPTTPGLAARVLTTLTQCCQDGTLRVNQVPGQVFVQGEETLVVVPMALKIVTERLAAQGITTPPGVLLYNDLAQAGYLLGPAGRNVAQATLARPGKAPVTLAVLRLPTALLWGAMPPAAYRGTFVVRHPDDATSHDAAVVAPAEGVPHGHATP
jgi:hypothetical protein